MIEEGEAPSLNEEALALVGYWRKTVIQFEQPVEYNLVLKSDGSFEEWVATAAGADAPVSGRWQADGSTLALRAEGSEESSAPWFIHEGQLVYPNIEGNRRFWDRIE